MSDNLNQPRSAKAMRCRHVPPARGSFRGPRATIPTPRAAAAAKQVHPSTDFNTEAKMVVSLAPSLLNGKPYLPCTCRRDPRRIQTKHLKGRFGSMQQCSIRAAQARAMPTPTSQPPGSDRWAANFNTYLTVRTKLRSRAKCETPCLLALAATPRDARSATLRLLLRINGGCARAKIAATPRHLRPPQRWRVSAGRAINDAALALRPVSRRAPPVACGNSQFTP